MPGRIDPTFMDVPPEVLITAMRAHQSTSRCWTMTGGSRRAAARRQHGSHRRRRSIVAGNERVLRARLSDAKFFWDEDCKRSLESRVPKLAERVFHAKLGSDLQRSERLALLARASAKLLGADAELAERAVRLCKADLTTAMVGEFPELQGVMGRYYALHDGEPAGGRCDRRALFAPRPVRPLSDGSRQHRRGARGQARYAGRLLRHRREANGLQGPICPAARSSGRLAHRYREPAPLKPAIAVGHCAQRLSAQRDRRPPRVVMDDLLDFFADRLKVHLREQGVRHDLIAAVFAGGAEDDIVRLLARVDALRDFLDTEDGANFADSLPAGEATSSASKKTKTARSTTGRRTRGFLRNNRKSNCSRRRRAPRIAAALAGERFGEAMAALAGLRAGGRVLRPRHRQLFAVPNWRANRLRLLADPIGARRGGGLFANRG